MQAKAILTDQVQRHPHSVSVRFGAHDITVPEPLAGLLTGLLDTGRRYIGDHTQPMAVPRTEQERAGDTLGVVEGVVMQEAGQQRPAVVAVDGCPGRPAKCGHHQRGAVVVFGGRSRGSPGPGSPRARGSASGRRGTAGLRRG